jgi:aldehyde dehydrogenase (NAD+)
VQPAFDSLKETFRSGKTKPAKWRVAQLEAFAKGLDEMTEEFCKALEQDHGRSEFVSWLCEIGLNCATAKHTIRSLPGWMKEETIQSELLFTPCSTRIKYEPLGVTAIFGSWNYPLGTTLKPLIDAIAAGNCAIVRPSEMTENTANAMKKFVDTYLDNDAFKVCNGQMEVAIALNKLPLDLICFTGSTRVGKIIAKTAADNLTPCILELGGKCPMVVDYTAEMTHTTAKTAFGKFMNCG